MKKQRRRFRAIESRSNGLPPISFTFRGFCPYRGGKTKYLAVVMCEGDPEFWELDNTGSALKELIRFYETQELLYNEPIIFKGDE